MIAEEDADIDTDLPGEPYTMLRCAIIQQNHVHAHKVLLLLVGRYFPPHMLSKGTKSLGHPYFPQSDLPPLHCTL